MTESTGFPDATPPEDAAPAAEDAAPEPAEAPVAEEEAPPAEDVTEAPSAPWLPDGQPEWLVLAFNGLHERLTKLGG